MSAASTPRNSVRARIGSVLRLRCGRRRPLLRLAVGGAPAPDLGALAPLQHALAIDIGHDVAIAAEQRLRRAHLGTRRQLALRQPIGTVLLELLLGVVW